MSSRLYDLVIFGATGYTGKLTAEHVVKALPTDLKWALAGRSASKLEAVAAECKSSNPDRIQPAIEICNLDTEGLNSLAKKTKVLIATIGPYAFHGEHAFKACAENGTHYLDATGEVPWVAEMIKKYERTAKQSGAIMIPQIGVESAPPDVVTWTLVNMIKEKFSAPTAEVVVSVHEINSKPSGGTLATVLSITEAYNLREIGAALSPYAISPIPGPKTSNPTSWTTKAFGIRAVQDLGILTTSLAGTSDRAIVQRSWGLLGYGPRFYFSEYMKARNYLTGVFFHFALIIGTVCIAIPFIRNLAKKYVYQPGEGPTKEEYKNDRFEYRGLGKPDIETPNAPRAFCRFSYESSCYAFTGMSLSEAAASLLKDNHTLPGGVYTPASLGQKFIDRLQSGGVTIEKKFYE